MMPTRNRIAVLIDEIFGALGSLLYQCVAGVFAVGFALLSCFVAYTYWLAPLDMLPIVKVMILLLVAAGSGIIGYFVGLGWPVYLLVIVFYCIGKAIAVGA
jgi:hypothetical protein